MADFVGKRFCDSRKWNFRIDIDRIESAEHTVYKAIILTHRHAGNVSDTSSPQLGFNILVSIHVPPPRKSGLGGGGQFMQQFARRANVWSRFNATLKKHNGPQYIEIHHIDNTCPWLGDPGVRSVLTVS